jgi:hypothetical protein
MPSYAKHAWVFVESDDVQRFQTTLVMRDRVAVLFNVSFSLFTLEPVFRADVRGAQPAQLVVLAWLRLGELKILNGTVAALVVLNERLNRVFVFLTVTNQ